jgi:hypothetical protein
MIRKNYRMMNAKIWSLIAILALLAAPALSQILDEEPLPAGEARSRIQAARAAYITNRLGLTTKESEQFWALHNEFEQQKEQIEAKYAAKGGLDRLSDQEVEQQILGRFQMEQEVLNLRREYYQRLKTVVPPRKIALYYQVEREFRLELLRRVQERRAGQGVPPRRPGRF